MLSRFPVLKVCLGVRLVERTTRAVASTPAGERLLDRLSPLLDEYQAAFESLNDFHSKPAGSLRLTVAPPAGRRFTVGAPEGDITFYRTLSHLSNGFQDLRLMTAPRIGLALGSGAARGWSHIGIIESLAEAGIEADIVCGTSIGSLVGAAYVAGRLTERTGRV